MDEVVAYLPASGHNFWAGYYDLRHLPSNPDATILDEDLDLVTVEPVIGWIVLRDEDGDVRPFPLTPDGPLLPGIPRYLEHDAETAEKTAKASLKSFIERRAASDGTAQLSMH